jgi:hypothetical protein
VLLGVVVGGEPGDPARDHRDAVVGRAVLRQTVQAVAVLPHAARRAGDRRVAVDEGAGGMLGPRAVQVVGVVQAQLVVALRLAGLHEQVPAPAVADRRGVDQRATGDQVALVAPRGRAVDRPVQAHRPRLGRLGDQVQLAVVAEHERVGQVEGFVEHDPAPVPRHGVGAGREADHAALLEAVLHLHEQVPGAVVVQQEGVGDERRVPVGDRRPVDDGRRAVGGGVRLPR